MGNLQDELFWFDEADGEDLWDVDDEWIDDGPTWEDVLEWQGKGWLWD